MAVSKLMANALAFGIALLLALAVAGGVFLATMSVRDGRPRVDFIITIEPPWSWIVWVVGALTFMVALLVLGRYFGRRFGKSAPP